MQHCRMHIAYAHCCKVVTRHRFHSNSSRILSVIWLFCGKIMEGAIFCFRNKYSASCAVNTSRECLDTPRLQGPSVQKFHSFCPFGSCWPVFVVFFFTFNVVPLSCTDSIKVFTVAIIPPLAHTKCVVSHI